MATFHYSAFHIRVSTDLKLNSLLSQQGLETSIQTHFALSVRTQTGRLRTGFEYFASIERNAELTGVPVFARSGTICRYFEKISVTPNRYLYLSLYLLRERINIRSHSQSPIILVTVHGYLGKRLREGVCFVYASCRNSHALTDRRNFEFTALANLAADAKAQERDGV